MIPEKIILISDPAILEVPIKECGEPLVDLLLKYPEIFVDTTRENVQRISPSISLARESVAKKLSRAQRLLPEGIRLKVKECYRPPTVQKELFTRYLNTLSICHSDWSKEQLYKEASKYVSPPHIIPPHSTGGAVDITLMTGRGSELTMGTRCNASPEECGNATYTFATRISDEAKRNRQVLTDVMSRSGFVNYPTEWWHWSYGDRYWAYHTNQSHAMFGAV